MKTLDINASAPEEPEQSEYEKIMSAFGAGVEEVKTAAENATTAAESASADATSAATSATSAEDISSQSTETVIIEMRVNAR